MFGRTVHLYLCSINDTLFIILLALEVIHDHGYTRHNARDIMPSGATQEDTNQLDRLPNYPVLRSSSAITHECICHLETEEAARVKVDHHSSSMSFFT